MAGVCVRAYARARVCVCVFCPRQICSHLCLAAHEKDCTILVWSIFGGTSERVGVAARVKELAAVDTCGGE